MFETATQTAFRQAAPDPAALFGWPAGFGTRFAVCIDTEEEFDWNAPLSRDSRSVTAIDSLPAMHAWFARRGVPLTYLVDHPVATTSSSIAVLRGLMDDGVTTIGTHLHPWVTPPFDEIVSPQTSFAGNLAPALEAAKLDAIGEAIIAAFGVAPQIYRAGRYGLGPHSLALLAERGYRIDTSMRSGYCYTGEGGPDFRAIGNQAFRCGPRDALLELPLTTIYTGALARGGAGLHDALGRVPRGRGLAARLRLMARVALTPEKMPLGAALGAIEAALDQKVSLLNFSFHSPTVVPGHTPYVRDTRDLAAFYAWWEAVLALLGSRGVRPVSGHDLLAATHAPALASPARPPLGGAVVGACSSTG
ncbi:polysaccharide deacetylase family protein [Sphingomonas qomolangmaensis]|uniref:Polysaccharide deacetylase family protein n=1 Tax=Sphingomonas qomolangmaensis TaxID=2918765 RepID=A0ABY5LDE0_9SPHN|nr:polysaccharide deacetylase family protein [Sphingomonas qomolangmaensis]UUL83688.1 polysaccharide deacetylase family protein [Sphingomonas qomolangmaensis]